MQYMHPPKHKFPFDFTLDLDKMMKFEPVKIDKIFFESLEKIAQGSSFFKPT